MSQDEGFAAVVGDVFMYRGRTRFLRRQAGAGQILDVDEANQILFVRLFDASGDELRPFIEFVPITREAFISSEPRVVKRLDLPTGWTSLRAEWQEKWKTDEAGVFSIPLSEVSQNTLDTVDHLRDFDPADRAFVELAYPKRSGTGEFDTIAAFVQTASVEE